MTYIHSHSSPHFALASPSQSTPNRLFYKPANQAAATFSAQSRHAASQGMMEAELLEKFPWTHDVAHPDVTLKDLADPVAAAMGSSTEKTDGMTMALKMVGGFMNRAKTFKKISKTYKKTSMNYLPEEIKQDIKQYKRFKYWVDWLLKGKIYAETHLIELQGPPAIKNLQTRVTNNRPGILMYQKELDKLQQQSPEDYDTGNRWSNLINRFLLRPMQIRFYKKQINEYKVEKKLVYNASQVPLSHFKQEVNELKTLYKKQSQTGDSIVSVGQAYRSASMAQTFEAKTQQGQELIIKCVRPRLTPEFMVKYRKYLYFINLMKFGTDIKGQFMAASDAQLQVDYLTREANLKNEFNNYTVCNEEKERLKLGNFRIPKAYGVTENGRGLLMEKTGNVTFEELTAEQIGQLLVKSGPDMAAFQLFSKKKHGDLTGGNITASANITEQGDQRTIELIDDKPVNLIDKGRTLDMVSNRQSQLLDVMLAYFSIPRQYADNTSKAMEDYLLDTQFVAALQALLKGTNTDAKTQLNKLVELSDGPLKEYIDKKREQLHLDSQIQTLVNKAGVTEPGKLEGQQRKEYEKLKSRITDLKEACDALSKGDTKETIEQYTDCVETLTPLIHHVLNHNNEHYKVLSIEGQRSSSDRHAKQPAPAVFDTLFNAMVYNQNHQNDSQNHLGDFCDIVLPFHEIVNIRRKFYGSLSQYFITPDDPKIYQEDLKTLKQDIEADQHDAILNRFSYRQLVEPFGSDSDVQEYLDNIRQNNAEGIETSKNSILGDTDELKELMRLTVLDTRLSRMVDRITEVWQESEQKTLDLDKLSLFKNNLAQALLADFGPKINAAIRASKSSNMMSIAA